MNEPMHTIPPTAGVLLSHLRAAAPWSDTRSSAFWLPGLGMIVILGWLPRMSDPFLLAMFVTFLAFMFPLMLGVAPNDRAYLFAAPVNRTANLLARIGTGWIWCMVNVVAFLAVLALAIRFAGIPFVSGRGIAASPIGGWPSPAWWLVPLGVATVGYLISSAIVYGTRHTQLWLAIAVPMGAGAPLLVLGLERADMMTWVVGMAIGSGVGVVGVLIAATRYTEW